MEEKNNRIQQRYQLYRVLTWVGVVIAVGGYLLGGLPKQILPWVGLGVEVLAILFRFALVRCPHCGNLLTEGKTIPDRCPKCHQELH